MELTPSERHFLAWTLRVAAQVVPPNHPARERIPSMLARLETSSANGTPEPPARNTEWEQQWTTTAEAAAALGITERWARDIAARVGVKRAGRWWIPRAALPEEDE